MQKIIPVCFKLVKAAEAGKNKTVANAKQMMHNADDTAC